MTYLRTFNKYYTVLKVIAYNFTHHFNKNLIKN